MATLRERLLLALVPRLGYAYIRLLERTMKLEWKGRAVLDAARQDHGSYILAFWHSRFVMMPYCYSDDRIAILASEHQDAQMLVSILTRFGHQIARGSSTRGGAAGLRQILRFTRKGYDIGVSPDGPRGPARQVKAGVIAASRLSGLPIIPVTFSAFPARRLGSWDRTLLPRPFGRGLFRYGEPVAVPRDADEEMSERLRLHVEQDLNRLTDLADDEIGLGIEKRESD